MDLCSLLIDYCESLKPKAKREQQVEEKKVVNVDAILKSNDWKKENCTFIQCKKERENDIFVGKQKKKKNQQ